MPNPRSGPRMTLPTQRVLETFLEDPDRDRYGLEICAAAELPSGTIHPILARLERIGWRRSHWETVDPSEAGRPRRRYYRLDPNSIALARAAITRAEAKSAALGRLRTRLTGGTG